MNEEKVQTEHNLTPPYLSKVRIARVIDLASNRNFSNISNSLFKQYNFNVSDAILAVNTFKFLRLIDDEGNATESMSKLHLHGELKKKEFEKILREAYGKLFIATNDKAHELSKEELKNEFAIQYHLTPRVVDAAVPAFLKLCEFAGLKEETSTRKQKEGGLVTGIKRNPKIDGKLSQNRGQTEKQLYDVAVGAGFKPVRVAEGRMVLNIPSELQNRILEGDEEILHKDWRDIRAELKNFADKYIPENFSEKEDSGEDKKV